MADITELSSKLEPTHIWGILFFCRRPIVGDGSLDFRLIQHLEMEVEYGRTKNTYKLFFGVFGFISEDLKNSGGFFHDQT